MRKILQRNWLFPIIILFFITMIGIFGSHTALAQTSKSDLKIEIQSVNPGDDYKYVLKRLKEKIVLAILSFSSQRKANYYVGLLDIRLSELKYVVDKKDIANIQTTSQRYAAISGELTDFVLGKNLTDYNGKLVNIMSSHIPFLENLRDSYPYVSSEYRFVQDDANSLKSYIQTLRKK